MVTRGAIYHHFENKQALFEEVLLDQLATCVAARRRARLGTQLDELRVGLPGDSRLAGPRS